MSTTPTPHRRRMTARLVPATLICAGALGAAAAQGAAPPPSAVCTKTFTNTIAPGFTPKPKAVKISSNGQTGSIECFGTIGGERVTGPGTLGITVRRARGSCRGHTGTGRVRLVIPTTAGTKDTVGTLAVRRTGLTLRVTVNFPGLRYRGNGVVFPRLGDCTSTPLEQVRVTMTGTLRDV